MKKRLQVLLTDEAWVQVDSLLKESNEHFDGGTISYSDAVNEMVLCARVDVKALQLKHTDLRRSLRAMASKQDLDIEAVIKSLTELKAKTVPKRKSASLNEELPL